MACLARKERDAIAHQLGSVGGVKKWGCLLRKLYECGRELGYLRGMWLVNVGSIVPKCVVFLIFLCFSGRVYSAVWFYHGQVS